MMIIDKDCFDNIKKKISSKISSINEVYVQLSLNIKGKIFESERSIKQINKNGETKIA